MSRHGLVDVYLDPDSDLGNGDHYWRGDCLCGWFVHRTFMSSVVVAYLDHKDDEEEFYD